MSIADVLNGTRGSTVLCADVREGLRQLPDGSVQCVVTSPPYWALRAYGSAPQIWPADGRAEAGCEHRWTVTAHYQDSPIRAGHEGLGFRNAEKRRAQRWREERLCSLCGAWQGELGAEPTVALYLAHLVEVFREVRRVLRDDGTCWINMGDCYAGSGKGMNADGTQAKHKGTKQVTNKGTLSNGLGRMQTDVPAKSLLGMPWRLAEALQDDGWILRQMIIWNKPAPMPEAVADRCTQSHEYILFLVKRGRYYVDMDAIRKDAPTGPNAHSVWTIGPEGNSLEHHAVFPVGLPRRCLAAGTSERGCCAQCGAPWRRLTERAFRPQGDVTAAKAVRGHDGQKPMDLSSGWQGYPRGRVDVETLGWEPTCACNGHFDQVVLQSGFGDMPGKRIRVYVPDIPLVDHLTRPCLVLDPFSGTGSTGVAALASGRRYVGIELKPEHCAMAEKRLRATVAVARADQLRSSDDQQQVRLF